MANKAVVYRIYPNKAQIEQLQKTFGCARFVYNQMLMIQEERYKRGESHLSKFDANSYCNHNLKTKYVWLKEIDKFVLTNAIYHLEDGYQRFFKHLGKHPKYKSKHHSRKSYTTNFTNNNIVVGDRYIKLPKLGRVKASVSRVMPGVIKSVTVRQNSDNTYQVSVLYEYENVTIPKTNPTPDNTLGLDYKTNGLYVDSNGDIADMPHFYKESQKLLAKRQRKLKHKVVGSKNYYKQQRRIAKIHRHVANQRKDFLHKKSTEIANRYVYVCIEDLDMTETLHSMEYTAYHRITLDNGNGMFIKFLDYKLNDRGGALVRTEKDYPSSQICSDCRHVNPELKDLRIRKWTCPKCGRVHDRDYNAAINIKTEGLRLLGVA